MCREYRRVTQNNRYAIILYCLGLYGAISASQEDVQNRLVVLMHTSTPMKPTKGFTTQYKRAGGYQQALQDFTSLPLQMVRDITNNRTNTGKVGQLPDGRMVNVRMKSSMSCYPTLEIQNRPHKDTIKFRYGDDA